MAWAIHFTTDLDYLFDFRFKSGVYLFNRGFQAVGGSDKRPVPYQHSGS